MTVGMREIDINSITYRILVQSTCIIIYHGDDDVNQIQLGEVYEQFSVVPAYRHEMMKVPFLTTSLRKRTQSCKLQEI